MKPPRRRCSIHSILIPMITVVCLVVMPWALSSAPAETDGKSIKPTKKGRTVVANKLTVEKVRPYRLNLSGQVYRYNKSTDFLDASGRNIGLRQVKLGNLVNVVYITDKLTDEEAHPFHPRAKLLIKVQVIADSRK
jgi:hypothetical protein